MTKKNNNLPHSMDELLEIRGQGSPAEKEITFTREGPFFASPLKMGEALASALAARALAANDLWELRMGDRQKIEIDTHAAAATALLGSRETERLNEKGEYEHFELSPAVADMIATTQCWPTKDGKHFLPHTNLDHLREKVLGVLKCDNSIDAIKAALMNWTAKGAEDAIARVQACGGMVRTPEEWLAHPQGAYLAKRPVVEIEKIADSDPEPLPECKTPLEGVRVIDSTRIIAGPMAGFSLAEHGADVLMVTAEHLPQVPAFLRDTSHGKRSCFLDLNHQTDAEQLRSLVKECDVFLDGYRPGALARKGFSTESLTKMRPGIIHTSVNCFGSGGPWYERAGWDQVAQAVTGMCDVHGRGVDADGPLLTPVFVCDFLAGYLAAYGTMIALARRARDGGSYRVTSSLCQVAMWLLRMGEVEGYKGVRGRLTEQESKIWKREVHGTPYGDLRMIGPVIMMSKTPAIWQSLPPVLGGDKPGWRPRTERTGDRTIVPQAHNG